MARKLPIRCSVAAVLLTLVVVAATGCASGRGKSKAIESSVSNVTPRSVAPSSVSSESSGLSGFTPNGVTPTGATVNSANPSSPARVDDSKSVGDRRTTESSDGPSRGGNSGSCSRCGG